VCSRSWVRQNTLCAWGRHPGYSTLTTSRLWGNPEHLKQVSTSLRGRFPEDRLEILVAKRNAGSFTYDGVDTGGERVADEIEQTLEELEKDGHGIKKISVIGYSLGGLVARFAIGLLYSRGVFEKIQPVVCCPPRIRILTTDLSRTSLHLRHHISAYGHRYEVTTATSGMCSARERCR
jgi:predicted esterase